MDDVLQGDAGRESNWRVPDGFPYFGAPLWQKALQKPYGFVPMQHENLHLCVSPKKVERGWRPDVSKVVSLCFTMTAIDCRRLTIFGCT
jgi:hypothetical protein